MSDFKEYFDLMVNTPILKGLALVVSSVIVAKLVDMVFTLIFKRLVNATKTTLDDRILQLLHKPIFYSILLNKIKLSI